MKYDLDKEYHDIYHIRSNLDAEKMTMQSESLREGDDNYEQTMYMQKLKERAIVEDDRHK